MKLPLLPHPLLADERALAVLSPQNISRLPQIKSQLGLVFPHLDVISPRDLHHLREVVQRSAATHRVVLAVGGDGTLHQVLNAVDVEHQILGIVPAGTGNDFARTLGLSRSLLPAIAGLAALSPQSTDFGIVNGTRYHNSAGFGVDSATLRLRTQRQNIFTKNYNLAFLLALAGMSCPQVHIQFDGEEESGRFYWVLVMNTPQIGGGTPIAPGAEIDDGQLNMLLIRETTKLNLMRHMPATMRGKHTNLPMAHYQQVTHLICTSQEAVEYIAVDGELQYCGAKQVEFTVRPGGMQFLRPPSAVTKSL